MQPSASDVLPMYVCRLYISAVSAWFDNSRGYLGQKTCKASNVKGVVTGLRPDPASSIDPASIDSDLHKSIPGTGVHCSPQRSTRVLSAFHSGDRIDTPSLIPWVSQFSFSQSPESVSTPDCTAEQYSMRANASFHGIPEPRRNACMSASTRWHRQSSGP
jgi:hypothetical protein